MVTSHGALILTQSTLFTASHTIDRVAYAVVEPHHLVEVTPKGSTHAKFEHEFLGSCQYKQMTPVSAPPNGIIGPKAIRIVAHFELHFLKMFD